MNNKPIFFPFGANCEPEVITFSIVSNMGEVPLAITLPPTNDKLVHIKLGNGNPVHIDHQQMMELGALFLAIAGVQTEGQMPPDYDSAYELLEGFNLQLPGFYAAKTLKDALT